MEISLIIATAPVLAICAECGEVFETERVTDSFGEYQRDTVCYYCHEYWQDQVAEWEEERWQGI